MLSNRPKTVKDKEKSCTVKAHTEKNLNTEVELRIGREPQIEKLHTPPGLANSSFPPAQTKREEQKENKQKIINKFHSEEVEIISKRCS
jgi:hypothetical protein